MRRHAVLLALLLTTVACGGAQPGPRRATPAADGGAELAPYVQVHAGPVGLTAADDGSVWVVGSRSNTVSRIPAGAEEPDLTADVPGIPLRATAAYGAVWVTSFDDKVLVRVDPATGQVTGRVRTGAGPEGVAAGFGSIWVVAQDAGRLLRIDPGSLAVTQQLPLEVGARLVVAGPDAMYVAHYADDEVLRVDPRTGAVTASEAVCDGPQEMAVLDGKVWVVCTLSEELVALDATSLAKVASVPVKGQPDSVAATSDGRLAVAAEEGPRLVVVDPATASVTGEQLLGAERALDDRANLDLALVDGPSGVQAWVSSFNADRVYHLPLPG
jgi:streptogramin lyase